MEELRKRHEEEASRLEMQLSREQRARREDQACPSCCPARSAPPFSRFPSLEGRRTEVGERGRAATVLREFRGGGARA